MSIYVHVKHYLNEDGMNNFEDWFSRVYKFMEKQQGFQSLVFEKYASEQLVHIVLCFEDVEKLEAWFGEPVHDELVNELDQYRAKDFWEATRTTDPDANWRELDYEKIEVINKPETAP